MSPCVRDQKKKNIKKHKKTRAEAVEHMHVVANTERRDAKQCGVKRCSEPDPQRRAPSQLHRMCACVCARCFAATRHAWLRVSAGDGWCVSPVLPRPALPCPLLTIHREPVSVKHIHTYTRTLSLLLPSPFSSSVAASSPTHSRHRHTHTHTRSFFFKHSPFHITSLTHIPHLRNNGSAEGWH